MFFPKSTDMLSSLSSSTVYSISGWHSKSVELARGTKLRIQHYTQPSLKTKMLSSSTVFGEVTRTH
ncbi:hypothetical protein DY000_02009506 [Brassica cretica]|uniref:Uncharacterized protein n=1 Tax=Brassica cretica TaxID=69181 RepID=A0ABQ7C4H9_BRACR|nr:hypothetical protein DY000_02009506 [Brassica cretica]